MVDIKDKFEKLYFDMFLPMDWLQQKKETYFNKIVLM